MFDSKKRDESEVKPQQTTHNGGGNSPSFYTECVADYHKVAKSLGYANRDLIFIPELIPFGQKTVLAFLQDNFFQMEFGNNPQQYYFVIMALSLQAGIVFADKWHSDFSALKNGYVDQIIEEGPADTAEVLLKNEIGLNKEQANQFYGKIFQRWLSLHEPYWKLSDPREYTFMAMLASYQLGISMILEKYGY
jgi:hypothetical protein